MRGDYYKWYYMGVITLEVLLWAWRGTREVTNLASLVTRPRCDSTLPNNLPTATSYKALRPSCREQSYSNSYRNSMLVLVIEKVC